MALLLVLSACSTSPTGRKQLTMIPSSQMDGMGAKAFSDIKKKERRSRSRAINRKIGCIAGRIIRATGEKNINDWEVVVFDDNQVNAFALPGKKIGIYTGLIKKAQNNSQIASVIGHEVGHVLAEHGNERVSQTLLVQGGLTVASLTVLKRRDPKYRMMAALLGMGATVGVVLPFSRKHESEADIIGLELMAKAGFEPSESVRFWQLLQSGAGQRPPEILSTHPSPASRIKNLAKKIMEIGPVSSSYSRPCP